MQTYLCYMFSHCHVRGWLAIPCSNLNSLPFSCRRGVLRSLLVLLHVGMNLYSCNLSLGLEPKLEFELWWWLGHALHHVVDVSSHVGHQSTPKFSTWAWVMAWACISSFCWCLPISWLQSTPNVTPTRAIILAFLQSRILSPTLS